MQYDADTPEEYLSLLEDDWRRAHLLAIRDQFLKVPGATEDIEYKMLRFRVGDESLGLVNAQRGYVSVYMGRLSELDPDGTFLQGLDCGRSCLRVKKKTDMERVSAVISSRIEKVLGNG